MLPRSRPSNVMNRFRLFFSLPAQLGLVMLGALLTGIYLYSSYWKNQRDVIPAVALTANTKGEAEPVVVQPLKDAADNAPVKKAIHESGATVLDLVLPPKAAEKEAAEPAIPDAVRKQMLASPIPMTLFGVQQRAPKAAPKVSN